MPIVNIPIANYKPFYIQYGENALATDTKEAWGMVAKTNPYPLLPSPKNPYGNDWKDEDGDDEYTTYMHYEGFEMEVEFYMKAVDGQNTTAAADLHLAAWSFFQAVREGNFRVYDAYTKLGFQRVRYAGSDFGDATFKERKGTATAMFKVKFKVNDPVTRMTYNNGVITADGADPIVSDVVRFTAQELTTAQKTIARENIAAAPITGIAILGNVIDTTD